MANVNVTIDGVVYSVAAQQYTVKSLINTCLGLPNNKHALTVLTDTGGTSPAFQDVKNATVEGRVPILVRGGEVYASSGGVYVGGVSQ